MSLTRPRTAAAAALSLALVLTGVGTGAGAAHAAGRPGARGASHDLTTAPRALGAQARGRDHFVIVSLAQADAVWVALDVRANDTTRRRQLSTAHLAQFEAAVTAARAELAALTTLLGADATAGTAPDPATQSRITAGYAHAAAAGPALEALVNADAADSRAAAALTAAPDATPDQVAAVAAAVTAVTGDGDALLTALTELTTGSPDLAATRSTLHTDVQALRVAVFAIAPASGRDTPPPAAPTSVLAALERADAGWAAASTEAAADQASGALSPAHAAAFAATDSAGHAQLVALQALVQAGPLDATATAQVRSALGDAAMAEPVLHALVESDLAATRTAAVLAADPTAPAAAAVGVTTALGTLSMADDTLLAALGAATTIVGDLRSAAGTWERALRGLRQAVITLDPRHDGGIPHPGGLPDDGPG